MSSHAASPPARSVATAVPALIAAVVAAAITAAALYAAQRFGITGRISGGGGAMWLAAVAVPIGAGLSRWLLWSPRITPGTVGPDVVGGLVGVLATGVPLVILYSDALVDTLTHLGLGTLVGVMFAAVALSSRTAKASLTLHVAWILAATVAVAIVAPPATLGWLALGPRAELTALAGTLGAAALISALLAALAVRRGTPRFAATLAATAGPALTATTQLLTGPGTPSYDAALLAVPAAATAAALATLVTRRRTR